MRPQARRNLLTSALLPGVYSVEVKLRGFKTRLISDIRLEVNQTARVDVSLSVGEVAERLEVTASADAAEDGHVRHRARGDQQTDCRVAVEWSRLPATGATYSGRGAIARRSTAGQKGVCAQRQLDRRSRHFGQLPAGWRRYKRCVIPDSVRYAVDRCDSKSSRCCKTPIRRSSDAAQHRF